MRRLVSLFIVCLVVFAGCQRPAAESPGSALYTAELLEIWEKCAPAKGEDAIRYEGWQDNSNIDPTGHVWRRSWYVDFQAEPEDAEKATQTFQAELERFAHTEGLTIIESSEKRPAGKLGGFRIDYQGEKIKGELNATLEEKAGNVKRLSLEIEEREE